MKSVDLKDCVRYISSHNLYPLKQNKGLTVMTVKPLRWVIEGLLGSGFSRALAGYSLLG
jgi:hypothetical protein